MYESKKPDFQEISDRVLKGIRGEETRDYLFLIINTILLESENSIDHCIQAKILQDLCVAPDKIPHMATFYRLLKRLVDSEIIQESKIIRDRPSRGQKPKYYEIADWYSPLIIESRDKLLERAIFLERRLKQCEEVHRDTEELFKEACKVLEEKGVENPTEYIINRTHPD